MSTKIMPITDLRRQTKEVIHHVRDGNGVVYITQHGRPTAVLVDYDRYEAMVAALEALTENKRSRAVDLLQSWIDEENTEDQIETGKILIDNLDVNRDSERKLFPADKKGDTW